MTAIEEPRLAPSEMFTVGAMAKRFNQPAHRVVYVINRWQLKPIMRAGISRVFGATDCEFVGSQLARLQTERERRGMA